MDVFLAELRKLAASLDGLSDKVLSCAFVARLPDAVRQLLRASCRMDTLTVEQLLARARAIMTEESDVVAAARIDVTSSRKSTGTMSGPMCFECNFPNHFAKDCLLRRRTSAVARGRRGRGEIRCFRCDGYGYIASSCSGKRVGERSSAPASDPSHE